MTSEPVKDWVLEELGLFSRSGQAVTDPSHSSLDMKYMIWKPQVALLINNKCSGERFK